MKNKIYALLVMAAIISGYFGYTSYHKNVGVSFEDGKLAFAIPLQKNFTTITRIFITREDDDQDIAWDYIPSQNIYDYQAALPKKIYFGISPFPFAPQKNALKPLRSGKYKGSIVVDSWEAYNPGNMKLRDHDVSIDFDFCVNTKNNAIELC